MDFFGGGLAGAPRVKLRGDQAWRLTCLVCLLSGVLCLLGLLRGMLADGVAGCSPLVLGSLGASGARSAGFRRAGGGACGLAGAAESGADPARGHRGGRLVRLPGQPGDGGELAGEPELGVAGEQQPGPPVGGGRVPQLGAGPAQLLLEKPERVLRLRPLIRLRDLLRRQRPLPRRTPAHRTPDRHPARSPRHRLHRSPRRPRILNPGFSRGFGGLAARLNGKVLLTWDDKGCLGTYRSRFEEHFQRARYRMVTWS